MGGEKKPIEHTNNSPMNNFLYIPPAKPPGLHAFSSGRSATSVTRSFYYSRAIFTHWIQFGFTYADYDLRALATKMGIYSRFLSWKKKEKKKKWVDTKKFFPKTLVSKKARENLNL